MRPAGRFHLQCLGGSGDVRDGQGEPVRGREPLNLRQRRLLESGDTRHQVGQLLSAGLVGSRTAVPRGYMRPDAVGDMQFAFHDQLHDVAREPRPGDLAGPAADHPVISLYQRIGALVVGDSEEGNAHITTMRTT
jgi:hypothetical protein